MNEILIRIIQLQDHCEKLHKQLKKSRPLSFKEKEYLKFCVEVHNHMSRCLGSGIRLRQDFKN